MYVVIVQLPTRYLVARFLHRPNGSGYPVPHVVSAQQSQCQGLDNCDYIVATL